MQPRPPSLHSDRAHVLLARQAADSRNGCTDHGCEDDRPPHLGCRLSTPKVGAPLTADKLYQLILEARPPFGGEWFSTIDTATRLGYTVLAFYRFLLLQPWSLLRFAYGWNTLW